MPAASSYLFHPFTSFPTPPPLQPSQSPGPRPQTLLRQNGNLGPVSFLSALMTLVNSEDMIVPYLKWPGSIKWLGLCPKSFFTGPLHERIPKSKKPE